MGIVLQTDVIVFDGKRILAECLPRKTAKSIRLGLELIALDREGAILFRPFIVFERELGVGSQEIGLSQIWLCFDGLIEILDRQHIVFHRQDIAADVDHLLGVDLCHG